MGAALGRLPRELESAGANYLAVAYTSEGIALRESQIQLPIMVMNPDRGSIPALIQYELQPRNFQPGFLEAYLKIARLSEWDTYPIHIKLETGMARLGFREEQLPALCQVLSHEPYIQIHSVLSHLASADTPEEDALATGKSQHFSPWPTTCMSNSACIFPGIYSTPKESFAFPSMPLRW